MTNNPYGATPEQLGVRPVPALAQRFLTHAFGWMFVGTLLTAAVAFAVQSSPTLTAFAGRAYIFLFIGRSPSPGRSAARSAG